MAEITASMVKELREKTDAPMMECKKALTEAAGDMGKAEEILRVKLGNKASKAAARIAAEGVVGIDISADGKLGSIIEVNCETDFVAKNDDFLALVQNCAGLVSANNPADVPDYTIGEKVNLTGTGPIRDMSNPGNVGDPSCYTSSIPTAEVHAAAGPGDHWWYLLAQGGTSKCDGTSVSGVGV